MDALSVKDLTKTYENGVVALKGVTLNVPPGDFFALLGPNGAGKSTLIGIVSSLVNLDGGEVHINGISLRAERGRAKREIGLVPQEFNFNQFEKPYDICVNQAGFYGVPRTVAKARTEKYLNLLQLWDKRNVISRTLSGGMKRRLMIARAMVHEPRLLILDEPTAGVDIEIRRSMWKFLQEINAAGTTVILTTHYLEEAESLCRNVAIIDQGRIIENTSVKTLLSKLDKEIFVLDVSQPMHEIPQLIGFNVNRVDLHTLEIEVPKGSELNALFGKLSAAGIAVKSLRNKTNRLEELFVRIVDQGKLDEAAANAKTQPEQRQASR